MEFTGTQTVTAPIEKVWEFLYDVNNVASCAPGFQSLQETGHERWQAVVSAAVGPMKAKFTIDLTRSEMQEPERMVVKGRANAPGTTVEVSGDMRLTALTPDSTRMDWRASVELGGALANVGAPIVRGTIEKLTTQFFECLKKSIQAAYGKWS